MEEDAKDEEGKEEGEKRKEYQEGLEHKNKNKSKETGHCLCIGVSPQGGWALLINADMKGWQKKLKPWRRWALNPDP